jgi:hypothetical protein
LRQSRNNKFTHPENWWHFFYDYRKVGMHEWFTQVSWDLANLKIYMAPWMLKDVDFPLFAYPDEGWKHLMILGLFSWPWEDE